MAYRVRDTELGWAEDLVGKRFGKLVVTKIAGRFRRGRTDARRYIFWLCQCDCGRRNKIRGDVLKRRRATSCGCGQAPELIRPEARIWTKYRKSARKQGHAFRLSKSAFFALIRQRCHYCGTEPSRPMSDSEVIDEERAVFRWNGLDRMDSSRGYVKGNVVPCCTTCNQAKMDLSQVEFLAHVEKIHLHQSKRKSK